MNKIKTKPKLIRQPIGFTPEQKEALRTIGFYENRSMSDIVREAIDQYLERIKLEGKT